MSDNNSKKDFKTKANNFAFSSVEAVGKYLAGKTVASIVVGIGTYLFCHFIGIKPAIILAVLAAVGNLIPVVGPWFVMIICAVVAVFQTPIWALYISIFCIVIQALDQFLITPLIVGKSIDMSPLLIIVSVGIGSMLLGFWGLIFAVPIVAIVKIFYTIFIKKRDKGKSEPVSSASGDGEV